MPADLVSIGLAFIEGLALIISPCILPILPIIFAGSLTGSKSRPLGIMVGFILMFTIFTLFSRAIIQFAHIGDNTVRMISFIILILVGITLMSETLTEKFNIMTQRLTNVGSRWQTVNNPESGFWGGVLFGGLIGIIWTPCAGPILAAVIVQVVLQETTFKSLLIVLAFAIGVSIPILLIAWFGRKLLESLGFLREKSLLIRRILGLIIILSVVYLIFFPESLLPSRPMRSITSQPTSLIDGIQPYKAPEIKGIEGWLNTSPLTMNDLKGKVVLIDFWTYSCINCIRTLPYLKDWYAKYRDKGFEIIGVHSPEFQFEHNINNVRQAVMRNEILYPVALDNKFETWRNFNNRYWPAHYLINKQGEVVYEHFGEGEYDVTENNIRYLLGMGKSKEIIKEEESSSIDLTPETYFGYNRQQRFSSPEKISQDTSANYSYPSELAINYWALSGNWTISAEKIVSNAEGAAVKLHFRAKQVYMVMGVVGKKPVSAKLLLNGKPLTTDKGSDVTDSVVTVNHNQLYSLVNLANGNEGVLEIIAEGAGLEAYTFTFGG